MTLPTLTRLSTSSGGMPKLAALFAHVTPDGVEGDWQKNRKVHGGPDRAVCLYSDELYAQLQSEGINVRPGDLGENFTTRGIDLHALAPGHRLAVGDCVIEITAVRAPCMQLNVWHDRLHRLILGRSGWMAKVITAGTVRPGDAIQVGPQTPEVFEKEE